MCYWDNDDRFKPSTRAWRDAHLLWNPADRPNLDRRDVGSLGGRADAAASVGRSLPSTPQAGRDGWRARASRRACRTRDPHLVTPTRGVETPYTHNHRAASLAQRLRKSRRMAIQRRGAARGSLKLEAAAEAAAEAVAEREAAEKLAQVMRNPSPSVAAAIPTAATPTPRADGGCSRHPGWKQNAVSAASVYFCVHPRSTPGIRR